MGAKVQDITGRKFDRLTVISYAGVNESNRAIWTCICSCGKSINAVGEYLRSGHKRSCGCLQKVHTHGMTYTRFYRIWNGMNRRCFEITHHAYNRYGARGITVCPEWRIFDKFKEDMYESYLKHVKDFGEGQTSLDRGDNEYGNYTKENCAWKTHREQGINTRTNVFLEYNGEKKCITDWDRSLGVWPGTIRKRLDAGWELDRALTTPPNKNNGLLKLYKK